MLEIKPKKQNNKKKIIIISLVAIAVLLIAGFAYTIAQGSKIFDKNSGEGSPFFSIGKTEQLKGEGDGRINVLTMGMGGANHPGGMLTDSMVVISINPKDNTVAMLSIPRDLYVPIADHKNSVKINEVYSFGEKEKKGSGAALVKKTVGTILDLPIHYYVSLDFRGFEKAIDILGGIDVNVDKTIIDPLYPADNMVDYSPFTLKAGQHHLDGKTALKYVRSRETSSDFDRSGRQQKVLTAARDKALKLGFLANPKKVLDILSTVSNNVRTDLTPSEVKSFLDIAKDIQTDKMISKVLTNGDSGPLISDSSTGIFYLKPKTGNFEQIQQIAHEIFQDPQLTEEKANIEILNATKQSNLASKLSASLVSYGYTVTKTGNAKEMSEKTIIYDYSNGKKKTTLQFLKNRLQADIVKQDRQDNNIDISIILGSDYKSFSNNAS